MTAPSPPLVQVLGQGVVLLGPGGVALALRVLLTAERSGARDGIRPSPQVRELRAALEVEGSDHRGAGTCRCAQPGTSEPSARPERAWSGSTDSVDSWEVAQMLGCSAEYARRMLRTGLFDSARKVAGRWQVDPLELAAWRAEHPTPHAPDRSDAA